MFDPYELKSVTLRNRIAVSPMCQYSATDGVANEWHRTHLSGLARGGAGLIVVEATAVEPEGRITPNCLGLWNDEQAEALASIVQEIKRYGAVPGIQIAHAGRKASANRPWEGDDHIPLGDAGSWETIAPSAVAQGGGLGRVPREMTLSDIERVRAAFAAAAQRARDIGFEWLNLHFAHGYLAQNFFSPHSNLRTDQYGGTAAGRSRFMLETFDAVRDVWPEAFPLTTRFGVVNFDGEDEQTLPEAIDVLNGLKSKGLDLVDVSLGFTTGASRPASGNGFLIPVAEQVRRETGLPTSTGWNISSPRMADEAISENKIDLVMLARPMLADPHWPYAAAKALGVSEPGMRTLPPPYAHWLDRYRYDAA
nr:NADH:flavin oxidoreductase/NADH oxidase [Sphingobium sp. BHU LFT2]